MPTQPNTSYLICATPRSGSTLLCEALRNSQIAGNPDEYFGPMHTSRWNKSWHTSSEQAYFQRVLQHGSSANGVWGAKIMRLYWQNFIDFMREATNPQIEDEAELLRSTFPNLKYIFITRRNKVRQAISWLKFVQGSAWYWEQDKPQTVKGLKFQPEIIDAFLKQTAIHESAWLEYFRNAGVEPHIVVYEEFATSYEQTALSALEFLEIPCNAPSKFKKRKLKRQADDLSDEWVQRYLQLNQHTEHVG